MTEPYRDPNLPVTERVEDLLGRMTVEEKAGQLTQFFFFAPQEVPDDLDVSTLPPEQQAYARGARVVSGRVSAGTVGSVLFVRDAALANSLQRRAVEDTRLGVPLLFGFDVIHGLRTIFPVPIATAASWDPASAEKSQAVAAREARDRTLPMPKLILHALQVNTNAGRLPEAEGNGRRYLKIPLDLFATVWD